MFLSFSHPRSPLALRLHPKNYPSLLGNIPSGLFLNYYFSSSMDWMGKDLLIEKHSAECRWKKTSSIFFWCEIRSEVLKRFGAWA
jgi:hypothetical protein